MFQPREGWKPVGGDRLEYKDSGFQIVLNRDPLQKQYTLFCPDGRCLDHSSILGNLQYQAEDRAKEREQFKLPPDSAWNWKSLFRKNKT